MQNSIYNVFVIGTVGEKNIYSKKEIDKIVDSVESLKDAFERVRKAQEVFAITIIIVCISFIFERLLDFFIKKTFGKNYENGTK